MTDLPANRGAKRLGLVIDLDTCVGCQACVVHCKEGNTSSTASPLSDTDPYGLEPSGAWLNRVHGYEIAAPEGAGQDGAGQDGARGGGCGSTVHFPRSCLHCENAACVTVCPTGASYKRAEDGIVLVDEDKCIGCGLCAWACPYGAREMDRVAKVMKKCTLCIDRIYNENLPVEEREPACVRTCPAKARHFGDLGDPQSDVSKLVAAREGVPLLPELDYQPTNRYLPPRHRPSVTPDKPAAQALEPTAGGFLGWLDRALSD